MRVSSTVDLPNTYIREVFPNTCQADDNYPVLKENPKTHCGPVAASNLLCYLAQTQYQMLIEPMGSLSEKEASNRLIEILASHKYMNTGSMNDADPGTTPQHLIEGLERYVVDRGFKLPFIQWKGWGAGEVLNPSEAPNPSLLAEGVYGDKHSIFHLGWYLNEQSGIYERTGGHFGNNVGYSNLNADKDFEVYLHDPSPRSRGLTKICLPQELLAGNLNNKGKQEPSDKYFSLNGVDVNPYKNADLAIVDGLLTIEIARK